MPGGSRVLRDALVSAAGAPLGAIWAANQRGGYVWGGRSTQNECQEKLNVLGLVWKEPSKCDSARSAGGGFGLLMLAYPCSVPSSLNGKTNLIVRCVTVLSLPVHSAPTGKAPSNTGSTRAWGWRRNCDGVKKRGYFVGVDECCEKIVGLPSAIVAPPTSLWLPKEWWGAWSSEVEAVQSSRTAVSRRLHLANSSKRSSRLLPS